MRSVQYQLGVLGTSSVFAYRHREIRKNLFTSTVLLTMIDNYLVLCVTQRDNLAKNVISLIYFKFFKLQQFESTGIRCRYHLKTCVTSYPIS